MLPTVHKKPDKPASATKKELEQDEEKIEKGKTRKVVAKEANVGKDILDMDKAGKEKPDKAAADNDIGKPTKYQALMGKLNWGKVTQQKASKDEADEVQLPQAKIDGELEATKKDKAKAEPKEETTKGKKVKKGKDAEARSETSTLAKLKVRSWYTTLKVQRSDVFKFSFLY